MHGFAVSACSDGFNFQPGKYQEHFDSGKIVGYYKRMCSKNKVFSHT